MGGFFELRQNVSEKRNSLVVVVVNALITENTPESAQLVFTPQLDGWVPSPLGAKVLFPSCE